MKEGTSLDSYLRREDTLLAKSIRGVCSLRSTEYRNSPHKRAFEFAVTLPGAVLAIPLSAMLGVVAKLEDGGTMFFSQERVGKDGKPIHVLKIRTMKMGAHLSGPGPESNDDPATDSRNTNFGRVIRALDVDELPQLLQVLQGDISLIDIRSAPQNAIDRLRKLRPETFPEWEKAYQSGKPGILNLYSAMNTGPRNARHRHHYDVLYSKKASLGLDLYIIFKTSKRMFKKLIGKKANNSTIDSDVTPR